MPNGSIEVRPYWARNKLILPVSKSSEDLVVKFDEYIPAIDASCRRHCLLSSATDFDSLAATAFVNEASLLSRRRADKAPCQNSVHAWPHGKQVVARFLQFVISRITNSYM